MEVWEATRTGMHVGDPGGVPRRDVPVEARGAIEHCGNATKELRASTSVPARPFAEKLCDQVRAAAVAELFGGCGGTHWIPFW